MLCAHEGCELQRYQDAISVKFCLVYKHALRV